MVLGVGRTIPRLPPPPGADPSQNELLELWIEAIEMMIEEAGRIFTVPRDPDRDKEKNSSQPVSAADQTGDPGCDPNEPCEPEDASLQDLIVSSDIELSGGRYGQLVKTLKGPPNSAVRGGPGRVFVTNRTGEVILDITRGA